MPNFWGEAPEWHYLRKGCRNGGDRVARTWISAFFFSPGAPLLFWARVPFCALATDGRPAKGRKRLTPARPRTRRAAGDETGRSRARARPLHGSQSSRKTDQRERGDGRAEPTTLTRLLPPGLSIVAAQIQISRSARTREGTRSQAPIAIVVVGSHALRVREAQRGGGSGAREGIEPRRRQRSPLKRPSRAPFRLPPPTRSYRTRLGRREEGDPAAVRVRGGDKDEDAFGTIFTASGVAFSS
jgi:hypothetical protein